MECKGKMMELCRTHNGVWLLYQLATSQKAVHVWEKVNQRVSVISPTLPPIQEATKKE